MRTANEYSSASENRFRSCAAKILTSCLSDMHMALVRTSRIAPVLIVMSLVSPGKYLDSSESLQHE